MKNFLLSVVIASASVTPIFAQQSLLVGIESHDNIEKCDYVYNENNQVIEIRRSDLREPEMNLIVTVEYDEQGREIRSNMYQDMHMAGTDDYNDYVFVAYIDLTYGENNLVSERRNYNNWAASTGGNDWQLGGVITYTYDEEGRMVSENTYFDSDMSDLFQEIIYEYNEKGLRESSTIYIYSFWGKNVSGKTEYSYNEDGRIIKADVYAADFGSDELMFTNSIEYSYDEAGNLKERRYVSRSGNVQQKMVFKYPETPVPSEEVVFPYEWEEGDSNEIFSLMINAPESYEFHAINEQDWTLSLIATYNYKYKDLTQDGIFNINAEKPETLSLVSFINGKLTLAGVENGSQVCVYSEDGRRVTDVRYNGESIDLSNLAKGIYIITAGNNAVKVRR